MKAGSWKGTGVATVSTQDRSGRITIGHVLLLMALLVLPVTAVVKSRADWRWAAGYLLVVNTLTFWMYGRDKRKAREGEWRVPEITLHLLELFGGWPAAFLAQRRFRHKCSKGSYQFVFWGIILLFQFIAFDSLREWRICRALVQRVTGNQGIGK